MATTTTLAPLNLTTLAAKTLPCLYSVPSEGELKLSERMVEVLPANYILWRIFFMTAFLCITVYIGYFTHEQFKYLKSSGKGLKEYRFFLWVILFFSSLLRFLWLLDPHERSTLANDGAHIFGSGRQNRHAVDFLLKSPQIAAIGVCLLQVKLWRSTVRSASRLRGQRRSFAGSNKKMDKESKIILGLVILLSIVGFGSVLLFSFNIADITSVSNAIFALYCVAMCGFGTYYAFGLHKLIHSMVLSDSKMKAVRSIKRIQRAVVVLLGACVFLVTGVAWNFFIDVCKDPDQVSANAQYLWFITFIHGAELAAFWGLTMTLHRPASSSGRSNSDISSGGSDPTRTSNYVSTDAGTEEGSEKDEKVAVQKGEEEA
eukprot:g1962.t1